MCYCFLALWAVYVLSVWIFLLVLIVYLNFFFSPGWVVKHKEPTLTGIFSWWCIYHRTSVVYGDATPLFPSCPHGDSRFWWGKTCSGCISIFTTLATILYDTVLLTWWAFFQASGALTDEEAFPSGSQSGRRTSLSINTTLDIISVNQLLESVRKTSFWNQPIPLLQSSWSFLCFWI